MRPWLTGLIVIASLTAFPTDADESEPTTRYVAADGGLYCGTFGDFTPDVGAGCFLAVSPGATVTVHVRDDRAGPFGFVYYFSGPNTTIVDSDACSQRRSAFASAVVHMPMDCEGFFVGPDAGSLSGSIWIDRAPQTVEEPDETAAYFTPGPPCPSSPSSPLCPVTRFEYPFSRPSAMGAWVEMRDDVGVAVSFGVRKDPENDPTTLFCRRICYVPTNTFEVGTYLDQSPNHMKDSLLLAYGQPVSGTILVKYV